MISYLELIDKDIINIKNGENIGKFTDIEIDTKKGRVLALYVSEPTKIFKFLKNNPPKAIKWEEIVKVGLDVIVVNYDNDLIKTAKELVNE
ncbi:YlmC/YmxH family sporulation protein [Sedimentibacter sp. zth1]|uniref:YlmC/YmxH family sporulation protein n=1 Tax=Sedimentibacter sp. zth1 TaxID=2816908 RepID=UPI001A932E19|nr:YlmC/YmxH family sporulation protein [Sedimentibacter sp. zth1]QSX06040.1 YlmC/YmxH family sporulation protein [Sedimentibacter sp. zth1]